MHFGPQRICSRCELAALRTCRSGPKLLARLFEMRPKYRPNLVCLHSNNGRYFAIVSHFARIVHQSTDQQDQQHQPIHRRPPRPVTAACSRLLRLYDSCLNQLIKLAIARSIQQLASEMPAIISQPDRPQSCAWPDSWPDLASTCSLVD